MSDSVDRVFVHALATVRRLPRTGSSRPPPSARLQLYGLYKQSMEGDVSAILPRPTLPPTSPDPTDPTNPNNGSLRRYASRDSRTREAQAEIEKWDAWNACAGMSRTEAKRRYITTLIGTMKEYASGTVESRELVSELEFVWNQIRSQSGSDESEEGESPTRKLERAGLKRTHLPQRRTNFEPGGDNDDDKDDEGGDGNGLNTSIFTRLSSSNDSGRIPEPSIQDKNRYKNRSETRGLRVLSPTSVHSSDGIVANEELPIPIPDSESENENDNNQNDDDEDDDDEDDDDEYASASEDKPTEPRSTRKSKQPPQQPQTNSDNNPADPPNPQHQQQHWRSQVESHLRHLTTELAALREQLSSSHLLTRSSFSIPSHLPLRKRILYKTTIWTRWLFWTTLRQACVQLGLLVVILIWGRIRGDDRVQGWCRERLSDFVGWSRYFLRIGGRERGRGGMRVRGGGTGNGRGGGSSTEEGLKETFKDQLKLRAV